MLFILKFMSVQLSGNKLKYEILTLFKPTTRFLQKLSHETFVKKIRNKESLFLLKKLLIIEYIN